MPKSLQRDQSQLYLLPLDLRDWLPEDDLAHFVIEAVERVPMESFRVNERGTGSAQYHPRTMLALLVYCYANGIFGSRRMERATYRDIGVRYQRENVVDVTDQKHWGAVWVSIVTIIRKPDPGASR